MASAKAITYLFKSSIYKLINSTNMKGDILYKGKHCTLTRNGDNYLYYDNEGRCLRAITGGKEEDAIAKAKEHEKELAYKAAKKEEKEEKVEKKSSKGKKKSWWRNLPLPLMILLAPLRFIQWILKQILKILYSITIGIILPAAVQEFLFGSED